MFDTFNWSFFFQYWNNYDYYYFYSI